MNNVHRQWEHRKPLGQLSLAEVNSSQTNLIPKQVTMFNTARGEEGLLRALNLI